MVPKLPLVLTLWLGVASAPALAQVSTEEPARKPPASPSGVEVLSALETTFADVIEQVEGSVVAIHRQKNTQSGLTTAIRGRNPDPPSEMGLRPVPFNSLEPDFISLDYGSGVVIGEKGEILTAFNVVRGARRIVVRGAQRQTFEAEVIAADPRSDLAVIAPRDPSSLRLKLRPIKLGDAGKLRKGAFLLALGNPFNAAAQDGKASASWGILSNRARRIEPNPNSNEEATLKNLPSLLQLDAKLNLGMSGGAVVNLRGELVGITTNAANTSGFDAQAGYAIPLDLIGRRVVDTLLRGSEVEYGFLGIGLDDDTFTNRIKNMRPGTPAAEGGLVINDLIVSVGGVPVVDSESLVLAVNSFPPGVPIEVKILHDGKEATRKVVLSKLGISGEVLSTNRRDAWRGLRVDYVSVIRNRAVGVDVLEAMSRGGVLITEVDPDTPAAMAGLKVNQLILTVDGKPVRQPADFEKAVSGKDGPVDLVTDGDQKITVAAPSKP